MSQIATFSQSQVYLDVTQAKQVINLLTLSNFYDIQWYTDVFRNKKESDELFYTVRSLVMVRNQLPAVKLTELFRIATDQERLLSE